LHVYHRRLISHDLEPNEIAMTEGRRDGDIGCVSPARSGCGQCAACCVGVEGVPGVAKIDLELDAKVNRVPARRHTDVAEIAGAIARLDVHAAVDGEMRKVAAYVSLPLDGVVRSRLPCSYPNAMWSWIKSQWPAPAAGPLAPCRMSTSQIQKAVGLAIAVPRR